VNGEAYIVKSNKLIEAKGKMTSLEQKIFSTLITKIQPDDIDFKEYIFSIKDFIKISGLNDNKIYSDIHNSAKRLMNKIITIDTETTVMTTALISSLETPKGEGILKITFHPFLKPYLLDIKERFTKYQLKNILSLKGRHTIRIYELLKQWENVGYRVITVLELKKILGLEKEYDRFYDFDKYVLKSAKKEINKLTDLNIDYEKIKVGRKIESIKFNIIGQVNEEDQKQKQVIEILFDKAEIMGIKIACGIADMKISDVQVMNLYEIAVSKTTSANISPFQYVKLNYQEMIDKGMARNKYAYLKKSLEEDYARATIR